MKPKQKIDLISAFLLLLIGIGLVIVPKIIKVTNVKTLCVIVFSLFAIINIIKYFINRETKDIEGLATFFANLVTILIVSFVKTDNIPMDLSIILMTWIILMSLIKLKKADYYHDRRDRMWKLNVFLLIVFIITGLLTAINMAYEPPVQIIIIGFFFIVNGILQMIDPIVKSLINHG